MKTINSYGIVLFTIKSGLVYFLVVRRRTSIPLIKLMLYGCESENEETRYIELLTTHERMLLNKMSYKEVMDMILLKDTDPDPSQERWFNDMVHRNRHILKNKSATFYVSWEFPKGRRNRSETILNCALREFAEETRLTDSAMQVIINNPYSYTYIGYDGNSYKSTFYIAYTDTIPKIVYKKYKTHSYVSDEIGAVEWLTVNQCVYTMEYENKRMLQKIHNLIRHKLDSRRLMRCRQLLDL